MPLRWVGIEAVHTTARLAEEAARGGRPPTPTSTPTPSSPTWAGTRRREGGSGARSTPAPCSTSAPWATGCTSPSWRGQLRDLGLRIVPNTGRDGRYIELAGIQPAWSEAFSARAHEVRRARELLGIETDVPARTLAAATRRGKGEEATEDHTPAWRDHLRAQFGTQALDAVDQIAAQPAVLEERQPLAERERELLDALLLARGAHRS